MYPAFNNARDGIFATCKICESLSKQSKSITDLVKNIPRYSSYRESFTLVNPHGMIKRLKDQLNENEISFDAIGNDVKILNHHKKEWILIHPSNTEPVVRVIAEAKDEKRVFNLVKQYRAIIEKKI